MIEEKDEGGRRPTRPAANDRQRSPGDAGGCAEFPDEGVAASPEDRLAAVEAELADTKDRLLRALAETENVRRRLQRERDDAQKYAVSAISPRICCRRSTICGGRSMRCPKPKSRTRAPAACATASRRPSASCLAAFERHGLKRIDPKGERFDHNFHQAIFEAERPDVPAGTVVEVLQPGYVLHDRLLRPAMVGVAKGGAGTRA